MYSRIGLSGAVMAAVLFSAPHAQAQQAPVADEKPNEAILVTGQREVPPQVARRYIRQISSTVDGQLTRFSEPVCPSVTGFAEEYNGIVVRRIRRAASEAGARMAGEGCRPNLIVMIAKDGDRLVEDLRDRMPGMFDGVDPVELQRAFRSGPVHVWNTLVLLNEDGQRQTGSTFTVRSASILDRPTQQAIVGSMVVIDQEAALGKSLYQLADYITMRALVGARPPAEGTAAETILTLFDPQVTAPRAMTLVDRSYLAGVYDTRPTATSISAKGRISRRIVADAEKRAKGEN